jgi:hypothetical protein
MMQQYLVFQEALIVVPVANMSRVVQRLYYEGIFDIRIDPEHNPKFSDFLCLTVSDVADHLDFLRAFGKTEFVKAVVIFEAEEIEL